MLEITFGPRFRADHDEETGLVFIQGRHLNYGIFLSGTFAFSLYIRLAPVLKTIFHQCVIYTCSQSNSDGSVLKQSHQN